MWHPCTTMRTLAEQGYAGVHLSHDGKNIILRAKIREEETCVLLAVEGSQRLRDRLARLEEAILKERRRADDAQT